MNNEWLCVNCGLPLGTVAGGELVPSENVPHANIRTRGPNLVLVCPNCGASKNLVHERPHRPSDVPTGGCDCNCPGTPGLEPVE